MAETYADSSSYTPQSLQLRRRLAEAMLESGMDTSPIGHWSQGLNRIVQAMLGGYQVGELERKEKEGQKAGDEALLGLLGPAEAPAAMPAAPSATAMPSVTNPDGTTSTFVGEVGPSTQPDPSVAAYAPAIANIESAHAENPYQALGPVVKSGDRAYGKYQVMGENIGPWTKEILGQPMTPEQFLASPEAQEKVFAGKFGQYLKQTGSPQDAASMWFTGRPAKGTENAQARGADGKPLGITGKEYVDRFTAGLSPAAGSGTGSGTPAAMPASVTAQQRQQIGRLLANPSTRPIGMAMIQKIITADVSPKLTDDQREYQMAQGQGYKGSFVDYQKEMKAAGRTQVNVSTGTNKMQEHFAKRYDDLQKSGTTARDMMGLLDVAEQALGSGVRTGFAGEEEAQLRRLGVALGVDSPENLEKVAGGELLKSVQNRMALLMRNPDGGMGMPGAMSDADRNFLKESQPGLGNTPEGNRLMIEALRRMERRKTEIAQIANEYVQEADPKTGEPRGQLDAGFDRRVREFAEANPLFADLTKPEAKPASSTEQPPAAAAPKIRRYNPETGRLE
jgi:hypothetical protein